MPAVVLLGARQVGKTTLAQEIAAKQKSIYLDLEAPEDSFKLNGPTTFLTQHNKIGCGWDCANQVFPAFKIIKNKSP